MPAARAATYSATSPRLFNLEFEGATYCADAGETVLDVLLRHAVDVPYSCRKGVCQVCLLRSASVASVADAQRGLRLSLREQGCFLACQCTLRQDMQIARAADAQRLGRAMVMAKDMLAPQVCRLRLQSRKPFDYRAGQFVNVVREDGVVRSYSLASVPGIDPCLEIHVKRHSGGEMSRWLFDHLDCGAYVNLLGPLGECHYREGEPEQPMLMIGTGTGLAPLLGIARDAINSGHRGPIHLYHGSSDLRSLYGQDVLQTLAAESANFHFNGCVSGAGALGGFTRGRASDIAFRAHRELSGWRVFLCGSPSMVNEAKKVSYLFGARLSDIYADPFELKELRRNVRDEPTSLADRAHRG